MSFFIYFRNLSKSLDLIDGPRMGAWGWGHGGYNTLRMLLDDVDDLLTCTIAVNPITDWSLYGLFTKSF